MSPDEKHVDDDLLTLLALGEQVGSSDDLAHLAACERCAAEVASLADVAVAARHAVAPTPPPDRVWAAVAAELDLTDRTPPVTTSAEPERDAAEQAGAVVLPLVRPRRSWGWVAAAAAAGVLIGGVGTWAAVDRQPSWDVLATAVLDPLPGWEALGSAQVETDSSGHRVLVVDLDDQQDDQGFREVWLLKPDVSGLVSVGTLEGTSGRFDLPAGLDLDEFSVVDVSLEQFDGDPAHSGDSIVRGALDA